MSIVDQIIGVESGGNPNATNPRSSASGLGQFIDSTWLSMLAKHRPDLVQTLGQDQLLALKSDPALSREMTQAYASDNAEILSGAGLPATPGNTYLAHFAGPQGAVKVLQSDPSMPVAAVLGDRAVAANPFLKNMTVADLQAWAGRKMGGAAPLPQSAPSNSSALPQAPQAVAPIAPGSSSAPVAGPVQQQSSPSDSFFGALPVSAAATELPPPIFPQQRKSIDISKLRTALQQGQPMVRGFYVRG